MSASPGPLAGRRILLTRPEDEDSLPARLQALGATVCRAPTIGFAPAADVEPIRHAVASLSGYDWLVLTSPTAARQWLLAAEAVPGWPAVAAVGEATAAVLRAAGRDVALVAARATGDDLAAALAPRIAGCRLLLPRSDRALPELPRRLQAAGADVSELGLYRTQTRAWSAAERAAVARGVDVVLLLSPSAVAGLAEQPGIAALLASSRLVAMGPTTAKAVERHFGRLDAVAEPPSLDGLLAATCRTSLL